MLKGIGIALLVLLVLLIAVPYLFKGRIIAKIKTEINKNLTAKVDFKDVDISLIRRFPRLAVALEQLEVTGTGPFEGDTLLAVKSLDIAMDLMSIIKGEQIDVYNITLQQPRIYAIVDEQGRANWDIVKPDTAAIAPADDEAADTSSFSMNLRQYSIEQGTIRYSDRQAHMHLVLEQLNHKGKGDFSQDQFTLQTSTTSDAVSFAYGFVPYLLNARTELLTDIKIDNKTSTYSFQQSKLTVNNLKITADGALQLLNDSSYKMDIKFAAPSTDFKDILSLVPSVFTQDFATIKTSGAAEFSGFVKGVYDAQQLPAYGVHLAVKNGFFQYPDLPKPVKNIQLTVNVSNPDGVPDHTVVDVPQAHLEMDESPVDMRLMIKTPVSDLYLDAAVKSKLDLSKVPQFVKFEKGTQLKGLLDADVKARGYMSAIEKQQYEKFDASGKISVNDMLYKSKDYPEGLSVSALLMQFNPKNVAVPVFNGQYLGTNFSADGELHNFLAYALRNEALQGRLNLKADQINLDKWMATGSSSSPAAADTTAGGPFVVPNNLDFTINAQADKVHYDKVDLSQLSGTLLIADQTVTLKDVKGNALQGSIAIDGTYSTKTSAKQPDISLTYDVKELDVQQTFKAFNTVQKLMPIAQFLSGKLSSRLSLQGKLGEDMSPVLNTLTGEGNLLLIQGLLKKFQPLDQLASQLNITALQDISVKDIKNYFAFDNGRVMVNPFRVRLANMSMLIGGSHGFDQSMNYTMQLALPRSLLGQKGNALVNTLVSEAGKKGVPVQVGDSVHLNVLLGGSITKPTVKTDLKETAGKAVDNLKDQATALVKQKVDSAKTVLKDSLNAVKQEAAAAVKDELKKQLLGGGKTDSTKTLKDAGKAAEKTLNNTLKGLINRKKAPADSTKH